MSLLSHLQFLSLLDTLFSKIGVLMHLYAGCGITDVVGGALITMGCAREQQCPTLVFLTKGYYEASKYAH